MTGGAPEAQEQSPYLAVFLDRASRVRQLLEAGVAPDGDDQDATTPLMESVSEPENFYDVERQRMTQWLLEAGADVHRVDEGGRTALHYAAGAGRLAVQLLLGAGAAVNATDHQGRTPLHEAADRSCVDAIEALCEAGAQLVLDRAGRTPRELIDRSTLTDDELERVDRAFEEAGHSGQ